MSTTFVVTPGLAEDPRPWSELAPVSVVDALKTLVKGPIEAGAANSPTVVGSAYRDYQTKVLGEPKKSRINGLVDTVHESYDQHLPLSLSPDDIWLAIAQGFANHVNANAEALRKRFVSHEGKAEIIVELPAFVKGSTPPQAWQDGLKGFSDGVAAYIGKKRDLLVCDFSTTGTIERAASEIVLMDAMQQYFNYTGYTCCGIPTVTLTGSPADWDDTYRRAQTLGEYECQVWIDTLLPVLAEFARAARGTPDKVFWSRFFKMPGGSGGPRVYGAINAFFPYLKDRKTNANTRRNAMAWDGPIDNSPPHTDDYPSGISTVPWVWDHLGTKFPMSFYGGFVGTAQDESKTLRPAIGWGVGDRAV